MTHEELLRSRDGALNCVVWEPTLSDEDLQALHAQLDELVQQDGWIGAVDETIPYTLTEKGANHDCSA